jgi:hypothetical protein
MGIDTPKPTVTMAEAALCGQHQPQKAPKRKPVPGKGFAKTRRGCFNCKRRRVKCSECRPECQGCRRLGMHCVYPATTLPQVRHSIASTTSRVNLSLDHLRFFHHFLIEAYPPHPHASSAVWQDVAALSHEVCSPERARFTVCAKHNPHSMTS